MSATLRILIIDDDLMMAKTLRDIFKVKGYLAETAHSAKEALDWLEREDFDCILSDIKMPDVNGVELFMSIKKIKPEIPVVLMTAYASDMLVQQGLDEGVIASLSKPLDINLVLSFFSSLQKDRSIVIVDDDHNFCQTLSDILRLRGFMVKQVVDPEAIMEQVKDDGQVLLLDMKLGTTDGLTVLRKIREKHPQLPVLLITGFRQEMYAAIETALQLSAFACFYKPLQIEELLKTLNQIHHQQLGRTLGRKPKKKQASNG